MRASKALLLSNMLSSTESVENAKIATFNASCVCTPNISVDLEPIQDLHGYDNPWPAGGGVNIWDEQWEVGSIDNTTGEPVVDNNMIRSKNYIPVVPGRQYYMTVSTGYRYAYDSEKNFISTINLNNPIPENCYFIKFRLTSSYGKTYKNDIAINYPATITTYSPYSNICPISGRSEVSVTRSGKNLLDNSAVTNGYYDIADGSYHASNNWRASPKIVCKPSTNYSISGNNTTSGSYTGYMVYWDRYNNYIPTYSNPSPNITTPSNAYAFAFYTAQSTYSGAMQIEEGSLSTSYAPYQGQSITIQLGQTVYGGTVDVTEGKVTITDVFADGGTLTWTKEPSVYNYGMFSFIPTGYPAKAISNVPTVISSQYKSESNYSASSTGDCYTWVRSRTQIKVKDEAKNNLTASEFKTAMTGVQFGWKLETPTEVTLTPAQIQTLVGENNVWSDDGNISVMNITCNADFLETFLKLKLIGEC